MKEQRSHARLTLWMSGIALLLSLSNIAQGLYQFATQDKSDLLANCAFDGSAMSELKTVFEPYNKYSTYNQ